MDKKKKGHILSSWINGTFYYYPVLITDETFTIHKLASAHVQLIPYKTSFIHSLVQKVKSWAQTLLERFNVQNTEFKHQVLGKRKKNSVTVQIWILKESHPHSKLTKMDGSYMKILIQNKTLLTFIVLLYTSLYI